MRECLWINIRWFAFFSTFSANLGADSEAEVE